MRHLVTAVVLALACSACVGEVAPEAGAEDTTVEASDGLGELDPGGISSGAQPLATLAECYAVARTGRESREAFCRTVPQEKKRACWSHVHDSPIAWTGWCTWNF